MLRAFIVFLLLFVLFPMVVLSQHHGWVLGAVAPFTYLLLLYALSRGALKSGDSPLTVIAGFYWMLLPFLYASALLVGVWLAGLWLLLFSVFLIRRFNRNYQRFTDQLTLAERWTALAVQLPEKEPIYTFEGQIHLFSARTHQGVLVPAKKFIVPLDYSVNGIRYQQDFEYL